MLIINCPTRYVLLNKISTKAKIRTFFSIYDTLVPIKNNYKPFLNNLCSLFSSNDSIMLKTSFRAKNSCEPSGVTQDDPLVTCSNVCFFPIYRRSYFFILVFLKNEMITCTNSSQTPLMVNRNIKCCGCSVLHYLILPSAILRP